MEQLMKRVDLTGKTFGRLTVVGKASKTPGRKWKWLCRCECGGEATPTSAALLQGKTKSCGCAKNDGHANYRHGHGVKGNESPTYLAWLNMKQRCNNPNRAQWECWGGRGILYNPAWESFGPFLADMGEAPEGMTLDRIDNNGSYTKENCRWATYETQGNNKRNNRHVTIRGERLSLMQAVKKYSSVSYVTVFNRLKRGWPEEEAILSPTTNKWTRKSKHT
jgi:hypothetical protein